MLKKSASAPSKSAVSAADGTSIMTPIGTSGTAMPRSISVSAARRTAALAALSSFTPDTKGNMIRSGPWRAARSRALSCAWKISSRAGLGRTPHRRGGGALKQPGGGNVLCPFGERSLATGGEQKLRSEQPDALGPAFRRPGRIVGRFDVGLEPDADAVLGDCGQGTVFVERLLVGFPVTSPGGDLRQRLLVGIDDDLT